MTNLERVVDKLLPYVESKVVYKGYVYFLYTDDKQRYLQVSDGTKTSLVEISTKEIVFGKQKVLEKALLNFLN